MDGDITMTVDISKFQEIFPTYMEYSHRGVVEAVNTHAYFATRNAVSVAPATSKEKIVEELEAYSKKYPGAPLVNILVNKRLGKGQGVSGAKMVRAAQTFLNKRMSYRNYLKAMLLTAMKAIQPYTSKKGGTAIPSGIKVRTAGLGGATPAIQSMFDWVPKATLWAGGKVNNLRAIDNIVKAWQTGIDMEVENMRDYIIDHQQKLLNKLWS